MKILISWSTGKDSAWMLHQINQQYPHAAAGLLTTTNQAFDRVAMHAVRRELLVADGFTHVAFGDLFLEDVRRYREERMTGSGLEPLFPIWKTKSTADLAQDMIAAGLQARLTCIDPRKLDRSFAGRSFDQQLLNDLPAGVDPCGENGEFHSFACAGPMFTNAIKVTPGDVVDRDGFVFADLGLDVS